MLWVKSFHLIFVVAWFAGLFYLPRLFVYHSLCQDQEGNDRFKLMERKLYFGIMMPSALIVLVLGVWMLVDYAWDAYRQAGWLHAKLFLSLLLYAYHFWCWKWLKDFALNRNQHSHRFFRIVNEVPFLFLVIIVILVIVKPL